MAEQPPSVEALTAEVERLKWRISTLETVELECVRAVAALHASEARYVKLLDEAGFPITISAAGDGTILFANPLACALFGLEERMPRGRRMAEFYPDPGLRAALVQRLRDAGGPASAEMVMADGRGHLRNLIISAALISYDGHEAVLATSNDITERRHAEALFQTLVEQSPDGFVTADPGGLLTYASPRAVAIFGFDSAAGILGRSLKDFLAAAEHPVLDAHLANIAHGRPNGAYEWTGIRRDGSRFPHETNGAALRNPDGSLFGYSFTIRDVTNRQRLERSLRWGEKLESLGLMAAGIARELNNAFQITWSGLELAQALGGAGTPLAETLAKVRLGVERGTALAEEMLNYSGQTLRLERELDLGAVVEEALAFWRQCLDPRILLEHDRGEGLPSVVGDEGQIMKLVGALLLNAVEALADPGGRVLVATRLRELAEADRHAGFWPAAGRNGRYLELEVRDAGPGMVAAVVERIFDPFFTTRGTGRGLGLSAVLGIVRAHSGCLCCLSEVGRGTAMRVCLPLAGPGVTVPMAAAPALPVAKGILVAEDDPEIREIVMELLGHWGYGPVLGAADGVEALEVFRRHAGVIGIVLTDATMPQMSGPQAFEAMRGLRPSLCGVLMTGYSEAMGRKTAAAFGFKGFLQKPFKFEQLRQVLETCTQR